VSPRLIHTLTSEFLMQEYSVEYWQKHWEELIERVENGEHIGVTYGNNKAVMIPTDDAFYKIYNNEAP